jgi:hypothetical protein
MPWVRTIPSRSNMPQTQNTIFYYHFYGNPPELIRYGRASIPTRLMSLGLFVRMPRCLSWDSNADKPEFFWRLIRIWRQYWYSYRIIAEEIYTRLLAHSDQIHSARYVTDAFFFDLLELCKIIVWSNWDFELLAGDWEFEKWTLGSLYFLSVFQLEFVSQTTGHSK